jgi:hypothetical protein
MTQDRKSSVISSGAGIITTDFGSCLDPRGEEDPIPQNPAGANTPGSILLDF